MALFACYGQSLVPVLLVGHYGDTLRLSCDRPGICQRYSSTELQGAFPVLSAEKLLLVGGTFSGARYLPLAQCWSGSQTGVCGYLPLSPVQEQHQSGAGPCWGCSYTARLGAPL